MTMRIPGLLLAAAAASAPALASAARYDPDFDRAALRRAATLCHSTVVDATGLPLAPEKAPAISAGLDEGLRLAKLAADAARSLDGAARRRGAALESGAKDSALDRPLKELREPVAAARLRRERLSSEQDELRTKVDALPEEAQKKLRPLLSKSAAGLRAAGDALRPLEDAVRLMGERALEMRELRGDAAAPLVEISSAAASAIRRAEELPAAVEEAKARLTALGQEPRDAARTRAWEKLEPLRGIARLLFQAADSACNRADDFRRLSSSFERASDAFERARSAAAAGTPGVEAFLDEARRALDQLRERLEKP